MQLSAEGIFGEFLTGTILQVPAQQGDGPLGREEAKVLGRMTQQSKQAGSIVLGQQGGPAGAVAVLQVDGIVIPRVCLQPVIDDTGRYS